MGDVIYKNEFLDKYVSEFTSRIVAESGIASDKYHLGKIILQSLKDDPDFVMQIDGGTGESETNKSVLKRSIQCAASFRNMGLKTGDVMILLAPNHLDQAIPLYAALFLGIITAPIDRTLSVNELKDTFSIDKPKIIICQSEKVQDVQKAVDLLGLDATIISFDKSTDTLSFSEMLEKHGEHIEVQDFKPADFDPEETIGFLVSSSGTTGLPKATALTHKHCAIVVPYICAFSTKFPSPTRAVLLVAPLQWLSALVNYIISPFFRFTRVQTSLPQTPEHTIELINKYEPTFLIISPTMMTTLLRVSVNQKCNFASFEVIYLGGSAVHPNLVKELKVLAPNTEINDSYAMSEIGSMGFHSPGCPIGSCGQRLNYIQYKLVNTESGEEIKEPNKHGELWLKLPVDFKGYYNRPEETAKAFSEDRWFKTGDVMYRDENWNFYFVEKIKLLLKYKSYDRSYHISPVEIETVIRRHPGVLDVAVTGLPDAECGELPTACVVPRPGVEITAQEIKDWVKEYLSDSKQLRGGVIFLKELPLTTSTKVHRRKLKEMVVAWSSSKKE